MNGLRRQRAQRRRQGALLAAGAALALASFWLLQVMDRGGAPQPGQVPGEPDYFVDNFSVVRMAPTGLPGYIVSGIKLTHHPDDDASDIVQPFMRKMTPGLPPTDVHAARARIDQNNSRVQLDGDVLLERAAAPGVQYLRLETPALTVFPDAERMQTAQPVRMNMGSTLLTGVGMRADNAGRQVDIAQRLRITYPPVPR